MKVDDMKKQASCDKELYPALLIALAVLAAVFLIWRFLLGSPPFPACWFLTRWHIYCPACGGTRAMEALLQGKILQSLYWNPAVAIGAASVGAYLLSQTLWRLRGRQGWALRYDNRWLWGFLLLLAVNCVLRNALWLSGGIPL